MTPEISAAELAAILEQTRAAARATRSTSAESPAQQELRRALAQVAATRGVSYHWPLTPSRALDGLPILVNRLVRRYLRWYVGQIVAQQNAANEAVAQALELMASGYDEIKGGS